jgi:hypothetical protein
MRDLRLLLDGLLAWKKLGRGRGETRNVDDLALPERVVQGDLAFVVVGVGDVLLTAGLRQLQDLLHSHVMLVV